MELSSCILLILLASVISLGDASGSSSPTTQDHLYLKDSDELPLIWDRPYLIRNGKSPRLSPAPEIFEDRLDSISIIQYHPIRPVVPTKPVRKPNKKPPRKPPPPPSHLVAESLLPEEPEVVNTTPPQLNPIAPLPPPIPSLSSQVHEIKEGTETSLPPPRPMALTAHQPRPVPFHSFDKREDNLGDYYFGFESADDTIRLERGMIKKIAAASQPVLTKRGFYQFRSPGGILYRVSYIADENGYQPIVTEYLV